jgi:hypothetical protein
MQFLPSQAASTASTMEETMSKSIIKGAVIAAVAAVGAAVFAVSAFASPSTSPANANSASASTNSAAVPQGVTQFQVAGRTSEMSYVPVTPCKLVDTRLAVGPFHTGVTRFYHARGTGSLAGQGGSAAGCGLPTNAAAISTIVSAVTPSTSGFIQANAADQGDPGITSVNYFKAQNISGNTTINLSQPASANAFKVKNTGGPTQIVVTVVGYYIAPMAAEVNSAGNLVIGNRVTLARVIPGAPGQYEVIFDRDVSKCYYSATSFNQNLSAEVEPRTGNAAGVFVLFTNNANTITPSQFYLTVTC